VGKKYPRKDFSSDVEQPPGGWAPTLEGSRDVAMATTAPAKTSKKEGKAGFGGFLVEEHYAECYPGAMEEYDATYDSDDEVDFSKMDMGNKKGPVKRWDFESEDDYNKYQSAREAMPKLVWYSILVVWYGILVVWCGILVVCCGILVGVSYSGCIPGNVV